MSLTTQHVAYGPDGEVGYLACFGRAKRPVPAVLLLQEAWGLDAHIEDVTRRFAKAGYAAFAPDLYATRGERPAELTRERLAGLQQIVNRGPTLFADANARAAAMADRNEGDRAQIEATLSAIKTALGKLGDLVPKMLVATRWLREECEATRGAKIASVGFCMGGGLSTLLAANDPLLAAAVVFYGPTPPLELVARIECPILGLYAGLDPNINSQVPAFEGALNAHGKRFEKSQYDGTHHAFFNDTRPTYHAAAARDAWLRTLAFLRTTIGE
jgi:carboxymethylenebutenolidase